MHSHYRLLLPATLVLFLMVITLSPANGNVSKDRLPIDLVQAFQLAVQQRPASLLPGPNDFTIAYASVRGGYAYLNAQRPRPVSANGAVATPEVLLAIGIQQGAEWEVYLEGTDPFSNHLALIPDTVLSPEVKAILRDASNTSLPVEQTFALPGLPWKAGTAWVYRQGIHGDYNGLDFATPDGNVGKVYSLDAGVLVTAHDTCLTIRNAENISIGYQHLNPAHVQRWRERLENASGDVFIPYQTYLGDTIVQDGCGGETYAHHVHINFFSGSPVDSTLNGWRLQREEGTPVRHTLNKDGRKVYTTLGLEAAHQIYFDPLCNCPPPPQPQENPPVTSGHFTDVPLTDPNFGYIEALYAFGAINGYSDGSFRPDEALTRAPAAKMIILAIGEYREYDDGECAFTDVCPDHQFYHYIRRLKELEFTNPNNTQYNPDDTISRGGYAKFVVLGHDREEPSYPTCIPPFPDVPCTDTFYRYVRRLKEIFDAKGIGLGYSDGTFRPNDSMSRGGATKYTVVGVGLEAYIPRFYDVLFDHTFYSYIEGIAGRGITNGCTQAPPRYCVNDALLRGQVAAFIIRGLGDEPHYPDCEPPFSDVPCSDTFYHYIRRMKELGITDGYSDGTYRPTNPITRGEVAKLIIRALHETTIYTDGVQVFSDVPVTYTFYHDIRRLKELGITNGYSDGTYRPDNNITRGEAAKFIYLGFVERTGDNEQEPSDISNNTALGATLYEPYGRFVVPGLNQDQDWVQLTLSASADGAMPPYQFTTNYAALNADIRLEIYNEPNSPPLISAEGLGREGGVSFTWIPPSAGVYLVRATNTNPFAQEGTSFYFTADAVGSNAANTLYLPLSIRE